MLHDVEVLGRSLVEALEPKLKQSGPLENKRVKALEHGLFPLHSRSISFNQRTIKNSLKS